jgi:putative transcriptional regulator
VELFFIFNEMNPGTLLVATPSVMGDGNFHRAVVLLVNHSDSGSIGFILNKKIEYTLDEVLEGVLSKQPLVFWRSRGTR